MNQMNYEMIIDKQNMMELKNQFDINRLLLENTFSKPIISYL